MSQTLLKLAADFTTTLTSAVAVGATTATLTSATDSDGVALPTGTYGLTIDRKNSSKEYIKCTLTSTALTNIYSVSRQGALTSGFARTHRKGAEVIISDFAAIKKINDVLDGTTDLDSGTPLKYDGVASLTPASNELATVAYVDAVSIAGAADATTSTKGISKMSYAPASAANPIAVGDNDPRVPTQDENDLLGKVLLGTDFYAASSAGTDTYAITVSPTPAYTNGIRFRFKTDVANTGAATLNVNSLGAITIKKNHDQDLATGDIEANQIVEVVYNSTGPVFEMISQLAISGSTEIQTYTADDTWTKPAGAKSVFVQGWGAGGGGGTGSTNSGGGGGGGGAYIERTFNASDLSATEAIVVGTGAAETAGENSSFGGTKLIAYGGGAGKSQANQGGGGGGGGQGSIGNDGVTGTGVGGAGGAISGGAGGAPGVASLLGGGGGGSAGNTGSAGGLSAYGGGGGGGGATNGGAPGNGGAAASSFYGGGGGGGGGGTGGGAAGTSTYGGAGGAGGNNTSGSAGSIPAGGGGGAGGVGSAGAGARGQVIVTTYF